MKLLRLLFGLTDKHDEDGQPHGQAQDPDLDEARHRLDHLEDQKRRTQDMLNDMSDLLGGGSTQ